MDAAPATITTVLSMHAGHICPSSELLIGRTMHFLCRHLLFPLREILAFSCVLGLHRCEAGLKSHALRDENRDLSFEGLDYAIAPALGNGL